MKLPHAVVILGTLVSASVLAQAPKPAAPAVRVVTVAAPASVPAAAPVPTVVATVAPAAPAAPSAVMGSFSRNSPTIGELMDLEARVTQKKMQAELSKDSGPAAGSAPTPYPSGPLPAGMGMAPSAPIPTKVVTPVIEYPAPTATAIYGTTKAPADCRAGGCGPDFQGLLSYRGDIHYVALGTAVGAYTVTSITREGITLTRPALAPVKASKGKRHASRRSKNSTQSGKVIFAPLAASARINRVTAY